MMMTDYNEFIWNKLGHPAFDGDYLVDLEDLPEQLDNPDKEEVV
jgi:hypothetical protein